MRRPTRRSGRDRRRRAHDGGEVLYVVTFDGRPIWQWFGAPDVPSARHQVDAFAAAHALDRSRVGYEPAADTTKAARLELTHSLTSRPPVD
jgi:hypothetical protein